jgi:hypothetical protein
MCLKSAEEDKCWQSQEDSPDLLTFLAQKLSKKKSVPTRRNPRMDPGTTDTSAIQNPGTATTIGGSHRARQGTEQQSDAMQVWTTPDRKTEETQADHRLEDDKWAEDM